MKRAGLLPVLALLAAPFGCTPAKSPGDDGAALRARLATGFAAAFDKEQTDTADAAVDAYLALLDEAVDKGEAGAAASLAVMDELLWRAPVAGASIPPVPALALRSKRWPDLPAKLDALHAKANHPMTRFVVAQAALDVAKFRGDKDAAAIARGRSGVFASLAVAGPLAPTGLSVLGQPTALEDAALPAEVKGEGPFASALVPVVVDGEDGVVDVLRASSQPGLFAAAGDVTSEKDAEGLVLVRSSAPFVLASGKAVVVSRMPKDGFGWMVRVAKVRVPKGRSRLVVRVPQGDDPSKVSISLLLEGATPTLSAPKPGDRADGVVQGSPWDVVADGALRGAAKLALGDVLGARAALDGHDDLASLLLATGPVATSPDVPFEKRAERLRVLYGKAKAGSPKSWEADVGDVALSAVRKGAGEARFDILRGLAHEGASPTATAVRATVAAAAGLRDVAKESLAAAKPAFEGTPFWKVTEDRSLDLDAPAKEARACLDPLADKQTNACMWEKRQRGDHAAALSEIARLRALRGAPGLYRDEELRVLVAKGAFADALALYEQMLPGERTVTFLSAFPDKKDLLQRDRAKARDGVAAGPLLHLISGFDLAAAQKRGRAAVTSSPAASGEATSVLLHEERWSLEKDGVLRYSILDVRRVAGTSDVERGGSSATFAGIWGRDARRTLYRRIHKKDGRLLEPDRPRNAEQADADLSQLEPGDAIEQAVEGIAFPDRLGHLVVDTPDLLPERTSVKGAVVEITAPADLPLAMAASKRLGAPQTREEGGKRTTTYRLADAAPRTFEDGVPRMDRDVSVSFGTYKWSHVARAVSDYVEASEDQDPVVAKWATEAAGQGTARQKAERLVAAVGKAVKVASGSLLSDAAAATGPGALRARLILDLGQGSRTWLLHRALSVVGVPHDVALAEREPFSQNPDFPARPGRYDRPLLVVHADGTDLFVDADVQGPPLPAGELSAELLGRTALLANGKTIDLPKSVPVRGDEVALDVTVDDRGDAVGTITLELRGRSSQALLDALDTVVGTDRRELLRRIVLGWLPWATVDEVKLTSPEGATFVSLSAKVVLPSYLQREGSTWVLAGIDPVHYGYPAPGTATMRGAFTTKGQRDTALVLSTAQRWTMRRKVTLPAGFSVAHAPDAKTESNDLVKATRSTKVAGAVVEDAFGLEVSIGAVPAAGYAAFSGLAKRVDDAFLAGVRVTGK